jgi:hypothetical protein
MNFLFQLIVVRGIMTMSLQNLDNIITEFPEERDSVKRLEGYLRSAIEAGIDRELTVQRLYDVVHPSSQRALAKILIRLVQAGIFKEVVRVESDASGGIADFSSLLDVPPVIFDGRIGRIVEVRSDQIHLIYKLEVA